MRLCVELGMIVSLASTRSHERVLTYHIFVEVHIVRVREGQVDVLDNLGKEERLSMVDVSRVFPANIPDSVNPNPWPAVLLDALKARDSAVKVLSLV